MVSPSLTVTKLVSPSPSVSPPYSPSSTNRPNMSSLCKIDQRRRWWRDILHRGTGIAENWSVSSLCQRNPPNSRDSRLSHAESPVSKLSAKHRDLLLSYASNPGVTRICAGRYSSGIFCGKLCLELSLYNRTLWLRNTKYIWKKMKTWKEFCLFYKVGIKEIFHTIWRLDRNAVSMSRQEPRPA